jgi:hypothetical protein
MPSRDKFDEARALFEEAVAMYEAAKEEFEALQTTIRHALSNGRTPSAEQLSEEECARARLFLAGVRLSRRQSPHRAGWSNAKASGGAPASSWQTGDLVNPLDLRVGDELIFLHPRRGQTLARVKRLQHGDGGGLIGFFPEPSARVDADMPIEITKVLKAWRSPDSKHE